MIHFYPIPFTPFYSSHEGLTFRIPIPSLSPQSNVPLEIHHCSWHRLGLLLLLLCTPHAAVVETGSCRTNGRTNYLRPRSTGKGTRDLSCSPLVHLLHRMSGTVSSSPGEQYYYPVGTITLLPRGRHPQQTGGDPVAIATVTTKLADMLCWLCRPATVKMQQRCISGLWANWR